jgi:protein pelota
LQIIKIDLRNDVIKLKPENLDDLWIIYNTVQPGDMVLAKTFRREKAVVEDARPERGEKKPIFLGIRIAKVEFHKYVNMVRLIGRIEQGVDIGEHHTINVMVGSIFSLARKWRKAEIEFLREAARDSTRPIVLAVCLEEGDATFAVIRQRGVDFIDEVTMSIPGKREDSAREAVRKQFHAAVSQAILNVSRLRGLKDVVIVGPELTRTGLRKFLEEEGREATSQLNISYDTCYSPGRTGIYEAIRRGSIDKVMRSNRVSMEISEVERLLGEIAKDGKATYGLSAVASALAMGAVDTLLMTDRFFRERRDEADRLMTDVEKYSGHHLMVSTDHEGGVKLESLGGLGAILRYRLTPS